MFYITIDTASQLRDYFIKYDRDYYSYEAYEAMLELSEDSNMELDVIALCCDYNEDTFEEFINNYSLDIEDGMDEYEIKEVIIDYLDYNAGYYQIFDDRVFYQVF